MPKTEEVLRIQGFKYIEHPRHVEIPILDSEKIQDDLIKVFQENFKMLMPEMKGWIRDEVKKAIKEATKDLHINNAIVKDVTVHNYVKKEIPFDLPVPVEKPYTRWVAEEKKYTKWEEEVRPTIRYEEKVEETIKYVPKEVEIEIEKPVPKEVPYEYKVPKITYEMVTMPKYELKPKVIWVTHEKLRARGDDDE